MYRGNGYIERHYPTMELEEIKALPVKELADRDCFFVPLDDAPYDPGGAAGHQGMGL